MLSNKVKTFVFIQVYISCGTKITNHILKNMRCLAMAKNDIMHLLHHNTYFTMHNQIDFFNKEIIIIGSIYFIYIDSYFFMWSYSIFSDAIINKWNVIMKSSAKAYFVDLLNHTIQYKSFLFCTFLPPTNYCLWCIN